MKNDHHSKFSTLSNWKEEARKKSRLQRDSNRDLCDTGAMLAPVSQRSRFESRWSLDFFQASSFQLLKLEIYCDDHSSLWKTQVFMFRYERINSTRKFTIVAEIVSFLKKIYKRNAPFRAVFKVQTLAVLFPPYPETQQGRNSCSRLQLLTFSLDSIMSLPR